MIHSKTHILNDTVLNYNYVQPIYFITSICGIVAIVLKAMVLSMLFYMHMRESQFKRCCSIVLRS